MTNKKNFFNSLILGGLLVLGASGAALADHRDRGHENGHGHYHGAKICHLRHGPAYLPPHYGSWNQYYRLHGYPARPLHRAYRHERRHHYRPYRNHYRSGSGRRGGWSVTFGERY